MLVFVCGVQLAFDQDLFDRSFTLSLSSHLRKLYHRISGWVFLSSIHFDRYGLHDDSSERMLASVLDRVSVSCGRFVSNLLNVSHGGNDVGGHTLGTIAILFTSLMAL